MAPTVRVRHRGDSAIVNASVARRRRRRVCRSPARRPLVILTAWELHHRNARFKAVRRPEELAQEPE